MTVHTLTFALQNAAAGSYGDHEAVAGLLFAGDRAPPDALMYCCSRRKASCPAGGGFHGDADRADSGQVLSGVHSRRRSPVSPPGRERTMNYEKSMCYGAVSHWC